MISENFSPKRRSNGPSTIHHIYECHREIMQFKNKTKQYIYIQKCIRNWYIRLCRSTTKLNGLNKQNYSNGILEKFK